METSTKNLETVKTLLKFTFGLVPIVAGADKFTDILANWPQYLHPAVQSMLPFSTHTFMMIVGVIEIIAGIFVLINTQKGAYLVSIWLVLIALNLITADHYLDVAVRDLVMAISAFSLAKLSTAGSTKTA